MHPVNIEAQSTAYQALAALLAQHAPVDGNFATDIAALTLYRRSVTSEPIPCIYDLGLAVAVQGSKRMMYADQVLDYSVGQTLLTTVDLPVVAQVSHATARTPFLGLRIALDTHLIMQLAAALALPRLDSRAALHAVSVASMDAALLNAISRLLHTLQEPLLRATLVPLIMQEITARLLLGPHGPALRHLVSIDSPGQKIARALAWLKDNFRQNIGMDTLAENAHMSPSVFRQHFREVAGMSPLQYQKQLRLQEARQLMLNQQLDAGSAALRVGYESASQFSREYRRLFGDPPQRDIQRIREDPSFIIRPPFAGVSAGMSQLGVFS